MVHPPDGVRFWSIGMNHIDSAALRYIASDDVWNRLCGAYIKNAARKYGFRDHANNQINETVAGIRTVNIEMQRRQTEK